MKTNKSFYKAMLLIVFILLDMAVFSLIPLTFVARGKTAFLLVEVNMWITGIAGIAIMSAAYDKEDAIVLGFLILALGTVAGWIDLAFKTPDTFTSIEYLNSCLGGTIGVFITALVMLFFTIKTIKHR